MSRPIVIGAGHNGLAAAFYLARGGRQPLVLDRRPHAGGGAVTEELHPGFHVPALTHEVLLHAQVARDMELARHGLECVAADARVCAPALDAPPVVVYDDPARTVEGLRRRSPHDADAYAAYHTAIGRLAAIIAALLEAPAPDIDRPAAGDLWRLLQTGRAFRALDRRDAARLLRWVPMPVADLLGEWFTLDQLRAALAGPGLSGTMLAPRSAGSGLVLLLREAHRHLAGGRSLQVRGGPGALTRAMAAAATAAGAEIRTATRVERIVTRGERVQAVIAGGEELRAELVLSSVDPRTTLLDLVGPAALDPDVLRYVTNYRAQGTLAKVNLALSALPQFAGVSDPGTIAGRIHLGPALDDLERAFDHVKYGEIAATPWLEVTLPSILDRQLAPPGAHVASVYAHYAPRHPKHGPWDASTRRTLLTNVMTVLEQYAPNVSSLVLAAQAITPADLEHDYGYAGGHVFHGELALDQLFVARPLLGFARYATPVAGLFLCGAGTHPGGFLTGASGRMAAQAALRGRQ